MRHPAIQSWRALYASKPRSISLSRAPPATCKQASMEEKKPLNPPRVAFCRTSPPPSMRLRKLDLFSGFDPSRTSTRKDTVDQQILRLYWGVLVISQPTQEAFRLSPRCGRPTNRQESEQRAKGVSDWQTNPREGERERESAGMVEGVWPPKVAPGSGWLFISGCNRSEISDWARAPEAVPRPLPFEPVRCSPLKLLLTSSSPPPFFRCALPSHQTRIPLPSLSRLPWFLNERIQDRRTSRDLLTRKRPALGRVLSPIGWRWEQVCLL